MRTLFVVEYPDDAVALANAGKDVHALGGVLDPARGIEPKHLRIREMLTRITDGGYEHLVIATSTSPQGEATATYLARLVQEMGFTVTRARDES